MSIRPTKKDKLMTTNMAAKLSGFSQNYIRKLIVEGKIKAEKLGHDYLLTESAIRHLKRQRFPQEEVEHGSP